MDQVISATCMIAEFGQTGRAAEQPQRQLCWLDRKSRAGQDRGRDGFPVRSQREHPLTRRQSYFPEPSDDSVPFRMRRSRVNGVRRRHADCRLEGCGRAV